MNEKESEIYRECIRPPPNRSVFDMPFRCNSVGILSDPTSGSGGSSGGCSGRKQQTTSAASKQKEMSRVVLDINGQPVVMRSKSMSTGSSIGSALHPPALIVMVPSSTSSSASSTSSSPCSSSSCCCCCCCCCCCSFSSSCPSTSASCVAPPPSGHYRTDCGNSLLSHFISFF